jgi:hypothetical protein
VPLRESIIDGKQLIIRTKIFKKYSDTNNCTNTLIASPPDGERACVAPKHR